MSCYVFATFIRVVIPDKTCPCVNSLKLILSVAGLCSPVTTDKETQPEALGKGFLFSSFFEVGRCDLWALSFVYRLGRASVMFQVKRVMY